MVQGDTIITQYPKEPGATALPFLTIAGCISSLAQGPRVLMLGIGGGVVAPLRAMGHTHEITGVDDSPAAIARFRAVSKPWAGSITCCEHDALAWLRTSRRRFDVIVDDLSVQGAQEVEKPGISLAPLPRWISQRLTTVGLAIVNLLPTTGFTWTVMRGRVVSPFRYSAEIRFREYENRLIVAGSTLPRARVLSRVLRHQIRSLAPLATSDLTVHTIPR